MQTEALEQVLHFDNVKVQAEHTPDDKNEPELQEEQTVDEMQVVQFGISEAHVTHFDKESA